MRIWMVRKRMNRWIINKISKLHNYLAAGPPPARKANTTMSQVNWGVQRNLFMEYAKRNKLTCHERTLYDAIVHVANMWSQRSINHEWPDGYFTVSNSEAEDYSGLNERAIRDTRNRLKQRGLIDFRAGDGKKSNPKYQINYLKVIGCEIVPDVVGDTVTDVVSDTVVDTVGGYVRGYGRDTGFESDNTIPVSRIININNKTDISSKSSSNADDDDGQKIFDTDDEYELLWVRSGFELTAEVRKCLKELERTYNGKVLTDSIKITGERHPSYPMSYLKKTIIGEAEKNKQKARHNTAHNFTQREYTAEDDMKFMDEMMRRQMEFGEEL